MRRYISVVLAVMLSLSCLGSLEAGSTAYAQELTGEVENALEQTEASNFVIEDAEESSASEPSIDIEDVIEVSVEDSTGENAYSDNGDQEVSVSEESTDQEITIVDEASNQEDYGDILSKYSNDKISNLDLSQNLIQFGAFPEKTDFDAQLEKMDQELLDVIRRGISSFSGEIDISGFALSEEKATEAIVNYLNADEYSFCIENVSLVRDSEKDVVKAFIITYEDDSKEKIRKYELAIETILSGINPKWNDYTKLMYLHNALCNTNSYDHTYKKHSAYNALVDHSSVCQGYAEAFTVLGTRAGFNIAFVAGDGHSWNAVKLDGEVYFIDCTWDDHDIDVWGSGIRYHHFMNSLEVMKDTQGGDWYKEYEKYPSSDKYTLISLSNSVDVDVFTGDYIIYHDRGSFTNTDVVRMDLNDFSKKVIGKNTWVTSNIIGGKNVWIHGHNRLVEVRDYDGNILETVVDIRDKTDGKIKKLELEGTNLKYIAADDNNKIVLEGSVDISKYLDKTATKIELNKNEVKFNNVGESINILKTVTPKGASNITWTSSDPDCFTVENGEVKCHGYGAAYIRATSGQTVATCYVYLNSTWQNDFDYELFFIDSYINSTISLISAKKKFEHLTIPKYAVIDGIRYKTTLCPTNSAYGSFYKDTKIKSVSFEDGVLVSLGMMFEGANVESVDLAGASGFLRNYATISYDGEGSVGWAFSDCTNLKYVSFKNTNLGEIYSTSNFLKNCRNLKELDLTGLVFRNVEQSGNELENCTSLGKIHTPAAVDPSISMPIPTMYEYKDGKYGTVAYNDLMKAPVNTLLQVKVEPKPSSFSAKPDHDRLVVGETAQIITSGVAGKVTYSSSNKAVATVSADGVIKAVKVGKATIKAKDSGSVRISAKEVSFEIEVAEPGKLSVPKANVASGQVLEGTAVILSSITPGVDIYYTLDGSKPALKSSIYSNPIVIDKAAVTIKAFAHKTAFKDSDVVTFKYTTDQNWGDVNTTKLKKLFNNKLSNVPLGLWYVFGDEKEGYGRAFEYGSYNKSVVITTVYDGKKKNFNGKINVFHGKRRLSENTEYTVKYSNNLKAGNVSSAKKPTVTITGKGNYKDVASFFFNIEKTDINKAVLLSEKNIVVNAGKAIKTAPKLAFEGKNLAEGKDYTLTYYKNSVSNTNKIDGTEKAVAGTVYIVNVEAATGSGFKGVINKAVTIKVVDPANKSLVKASSLKVTCPSLDYTGKTTDVKALFDNNGEGKSPIAKVTNGKTVLVYGVDYTVALNKSTDHKSAGKHTLIITGTERKGEGVSYVGSKKFTYKITALSMNKVKVAGLSTSVEYCGRAFGLGDFFKRDSVTEAKGYKKVTLYTVSNGEITTLENGKDYTYTMANTGCVGKFDIVFTGMGRFNGTLKKTVTVKGYNIATDKDGKIAIKATDAVYKKSGAVPTVTVKFGSKVLSEGIDYTLSYKNNKKAGSGATVQVKGIGNYSGVNKSRTFTVTKADVRENVRLEVADKAFKAGAGKYKAVPKLYDGEKSVSIGTGKDIEPIAKDSYRYYYASSGAEIKSNSEVPAGTLIEVRVKVTCSDSSSYIPGNYELAGYYRILCNGLDIKSAKVKIKNPSAFSFNNGKTLVPVKEKDIEVKLGGKGLAASDYDIISVTNNRFLGTAKVKIRGKGSYGGTKTVSFKISARSLR